MSDKFKEGQLSIEDIKELTPTGRNTFSGREQKLLLSHMAEFCRINGRTRPDEIEDQTDSGQVVGRSNSQQPTFEVINRRTQFISKLLLEFAREFPFRPPQDTTDWPFHPALKKLSLSEKSWQRFGEQMYQWLQKWKPHEAKKSKRPNNTTNIIERSIVPDCTDDPSYPHEIYETHPHDLQEEHNSLRYLEQRIAHSWSSVDALTLEARRKQMPHHLNNLIRAVSRTFGLEIAMWGVYGQNGGIEGLEITSPNSRLFLGTEPIYYIRDTYAHHLVNIMGPSLNMDDSPAGPNITADPKTLKPVFPEVELADLQVMRLLHQYFQASWSYYGGLDQVPYEILKQDSRSQTFALTDLKRYPKGESILTDPFLMESASVTAWRCRLVAQSKGELGADEEWLFTQPSPGRFETPSRSTPYDMASYRLPAESLHYARYLLDRSNQQPEDRDDGLPLVDAEPPYLSIPQTRVQEFSHFFPSDTVYANLIKKIREHDEAYPVMLSEEHFEGLKYLIPMFRPNTDIVDTSTFDAFEMDSQGFLPTVWFTGEGDLDSTFDMHAVLRQCDPSKWYHDLSGTYQGGPFGIKWAVLAVLSFALQEILLDRRGVQRPPPLDANGVYISTRDRRAIAAAAERLLIALDESLAILRRTLHERQKGQTNTPDYAFLSSNEELLKRARWIQVVPGPSEWELQPTAPEDVATMSANHPQEDVESRPTTSRPKRTFAGETGVSPPKKTDRTIKERFKAGKLRSPRAKPVKKGRRSLKAASDDEEDAGSWSSTSTGEEGDFKADTEDEDDSSGESDELMVEGEDKQEEDRPQKRKAHSRQTQKGSGEAAQQLEGTSSKQAEATIPAAEPMLSKKMQGKKPAKGIGTRRSARRIGKGNAE
ncbi:hypothetical protein RhiJN_24952 [Ceratobasidium sp. AG-Ba]|nr:hypothetical protein RhiJN_24952 [Ceratobasidium sp. AG-Ba]